MHKKDNNTNKKHKTLIKFFQETVCYEDTSLVIITSLVRNLVLEKHFYYHAVSWQVLASILENTIFHCFSIILFFINLT